MFIINKTRHVSGDTTKPPPEFDTGNIFNFIFLTWVRFWLKRVNEGIADAYSLPQIPHADRISYWQPIFSKHISDGLLLLEDEAIANHQCVIAGIPLKRKKPVRIILRAIIYTFWKRALITILGIILINAVSFSSPIFMEKLLKILSSRPDRIGLVIFLVFCISFIESFQTLIEQHILFYNYRLYNILAYSLAISIFEHGLCYRRNYSRTIESTGPINWCGNILHGFSDNLKLSCNTKLYCPASRHQNDELTKSIYTYLLIDSDYVAYIMDPIIKLTKTITNTIVGMLLIHNQLGMNVIKPIIILISVIFVMCISEVINGYMLKYHLFVRDYRISKTSDVLEGLRLLTILGMDDIGYNSIIDSRKSELTILGKRMFLYFTNIGLNRIINTITTLVILLDYIDVMKNMEITQSYSFAAPITMLYILNKIVSSLNEFPRVLRTGLIALRGLQRLEVYIRTCSPNYYFNPKLKEMHEFCSNGPEKDSPKVSEILEDNVVLFKNASFAYIFTREDVLNPTDNDAVLKNYNFELKRGDIVIVTGESGSGKTSFIRAILGELTLVGGYMAVAPLSCGMPIFYASQDVWFPTGTIKSVITFDYEVDENIYNTVINATELITDISSWDGGDDRVISEQGYSLSGGQRIRISLARALYAYMIHSKYNDLSDNKYSYLLCLDDSFNGLDPRVLRSIFYNLFNMENGLLLKGDASVVITMNYMSLNVCLTSERLSNVVCTTIYSISKNDILKYTIVGDDLKRSNFTRMVENFEEMVYSDSHARTREIKLIHQTLTPTHMSSKSSPSLQNGPDDISRDLANDKHTHKFVSSNRRTMRSHKVYFQAIGFMFVFLFLLMFLASTVMENINLLLVADWSDSLKVMVEETGTNPESKSDLLAKHISTAKLLILMAILVMSTTFIGVYLFLYGSIAASRRIHNYSIKSIFQKSEIVLKIKKTLGEMVSFLTADMFFLDECTSIYYAPTIFSLFDIIIRFIVITYSMPVVFPIILFTIIVSVYYVFYMYVIGSRHIQMMLLESYSRIYSVYAKVISGGHFFRCFRKEDKCIDSIINLSRVHYNINFMKWSFTTWSLVISKVIVCIMIPFVSLMPILYSIITNTNLQVAHLGLAISIHISFNNSFAELMDRYSIIEHTMSSVTRFCSYFLDNDGASLNEKFDSMNEVNISEMNNTELQDEITSHNYKRNVIKRRIKHFRSQPINKYRPFFIRWFFKPKIDFVDIRRYLSLEHASVEIRNVSVRQPPNDLEGDSGYILYDISGIAYVSEIIGLIGRSGAGKTSILYALQNIAHDRYGSILLDGLEINDIPRSIMRQIIGVLPQISFAFKGWTLRRFVDPRMLFTDDEIITALDNCGLLELIKGLLGDQFLETVLVEENIVIPGMVKSDNVVGKERCDRIHSNGNSTENECILTITQLRALTFARLLLYRNMFRLLLIDEPPTYRQSETECYNRYAESKFSTDSQPFLQISDKSIYNLIKTYFKHCTTFLVAHDNDALQSCTSIWVIGNGCILNKYKASDIKSRKSSLSIDRILKDEDNAV